MRARMIAGVIGVATVVAAGMAGAQDDPFAAIKQLMEQAQKGTDAPALDEAVEPALDAAEQAVEDAATAFQGDDQQAPAGGVAAAGMVTASDPQSVVQAMQDYGFAAKLETDDEGDPVIRSKVGGASTSIYFYGCDDNGADCASISFGAGFELNEPFTIEQANAWNTDKRFTKSYATDEGVARLEMDVNLIGGGVTAENFADIIDWWDYSISDYKEFIGW